MQNKYHFLLSTKYATNNAWVTWENLFYVIGERKEMIFSPWFTIQECISVPGFSAASTLFTFDSRYRVHIKRVSGTNRASAVYLHALATNHHYVTQGYC